LETGNNGNLALVHAFGNFVGVNVSNAGRTVHAVGFHRNLPALPGSGGDAHVLQHDGQKPRRDLLTRGDNRIIFPGIMDCRCLAAPFHQLVGGASHGRNHHCNVIACLHFPFYMACNITDAVNIRNRSATEFHDQTAHLHFPTRPKPSLPEHCCSANYSAVV
jgi:hypothetical protein